MVSDDFNVASSATFKTEPARHRSLIMGSAAYELARSG